VNEFCAHVDRQGDQITVSLCGELDIATAPTLERTLNDLTGHLRFDCADLTFVDSSGLAIFARVDRNGGATLRGVRPNVRRVVEVAGLAHLIADS
jgi:anti-sigma B factor antagonist